MSSVHNQGRGCGPDTVGAQYAFAGELMNENEQDGLSRAAGQMEMEAFLE